jgi:hypothetical protein
MSKIMILENNEEDRKKLMSFGWGHEDITLTKKHIKALQEGKCLGWDDGEYTHLLKLKKENEND